MSTSITRLFGVVIGVFVVVVSGRKRHLILEHDNRPTIHLSSFGIYQGGNLHVNLSNFKISDGAHHDISDLNVGFSIDRSLSDGINPYNEGERKSSRVEDCIFNRKLDETEVAGIIRFRLNFKESRAEVQCSKNLQQVSILADKAAKREAEDELSDDHMFIPRNPPQSSIRRKRSQKVTDVDEGMFGDKMQRNIDQDPAQPMDQTVMKKYKETVSEIAERNKEGIAGHYDSDDPCTQYQIPIVNLHSDGYQVSFKLSITEPNQEGLYSIFFHNCQEAGKEIPVDFELKISEKNMGENYLSAGEMPLPALYQMLSILFLLTGCFWVFILKKTGSQQVFRIHWIMAALVFLKSLSLFFHGVNYAKIASNGHHIETWAVLYYITHLIKGGLLFFTIVLIGSGWAFIKHILSSKEKKIFMFILPLQVIANVAYIIVEESEEGMATRNMWKEMFILIDLICCGTILLPVVWSIKHLQDASATDGKAAMSLEKLKLFRHFYIMVVCYVYLTRIIVYLLKITIPFQYSWFDETFKEMITFVFFVMTGYKFRPASNNPYFAVAKDDEEMEQILVSASGIHEQVVTRKSFKAENDYGEADIMDEDEDDETVVLFTKTDEISHELD